MVTTTIAELLPAKLAYSLREVREKTGLGDTLIGELVADGRLPSIKVGKRRLVLADDLAAFLESCRSGT